MCDYDFGYWELLGIIREWFYRKGIVLMFMWGIWIYKVFMWLVFVGYGYYYYWSFFGVNFFIG